MVGPHTIAGVDRKKGCWGVEADKNAKLEVLEETHSWKITELEAACTNLKQEKENLTAGYRRLSEKDKVLVA
jgi:hypothetical protein